MEWTLAVCPCLTHGMRNDAVVAIERANKLWILWNDLDNGLLVAADDNNDDALRVEGNTGFRCKILRLRVRTLEIDDTVDDEVAVVATAACQNK